MMFFTKLLLSAPKFIIAGRLAFAQFRAANYETYMTSMFYRPRMRHSLREQVALQWYAVCFEPYVSLSYSDIYLTVGVAKNGVG
jgi:hypothetical protein